MDLLKSTDEVVHSKKPQPAKSVKPLTPPSAMDLLKSTQEQQQQHQQHQQQQQQQQQQQHQQQQQQQQQQQSAQNMSTSTHDQQCTPDSAWTPSDSLSNDPEPDTNDDIH